MKSFSRCVLLFLAISAQARNWSEVRTPTAPPSNALGSYAQGCLAGARNLAADGIGFHVMRRERHRYFGHENLIAYLQDLATRLTRESDMDILIGDLGQARGGPLPYGHSSHQIGLDVDIWYRYLPGSTPALAPDQRKALKEYSLLRADGKGIEASRWTPQHTRLILEAADDPRVARIFVNPHVKKKLCQDFPQADTRLQSQLRKLRPWWGHDDHLHVRLHCPSGSPQCRTQAAIPAGTGCGRELDSWFDKEGRVKPRIQDEEDAENDDVEAGQMPEECRRVLNAPEN